ncbi:MAG: glycosyltransferase family 2 protein [Lunatimonas sp.]|uniref:glycosyltransferase family 2 protein n=1 Tax=Lunatimonas sp. TaxID=2060141 RepID=UPI00263AE5BE|nr:glycosyltransferase [Lunatimonas sp.]MCC5938744.1 glycosyltransferase family 2 protein [Lunatimonas sp.]
MSQLPLVSIICTSFNHEKYVFEALNSVVNQQYKDLELLVIDNGSSDDSVKVIEDWIWLHDFFNPVKTFFYAETGNYCRVFNEALSHCSGKYIIDLSADDILLPGHVSTAVHRLEASNAAVYFSNVSLLYPDGRQQHFYPTNLEGKPICSVPEGDVYKEVVERYAISTVSMVFRTHVLLLEGGYDTKLVYEDFDILVRLARKYPFVFDPNIGVVKRILPNSFAAHQYRKGTSRMLPSTYQVLLKIKKMNRTAEENRALLKRILYESKQALASANFDVADKMLSLASELKMQRWKVLFYRLWASSRLDISMLFSLLRRR